jgi:hypothetical protein
MKVWSAALAKEVESWPQVITRSFFGLTALYRQKKIFALLPRTRGFGTANSLAFKVESPGARVLTKLQQDPRVGSTEMKRARWFTFTLSKASDLRDALRWIEQAYTAAGAAKR